MFTTGHFSMRLQDRLILQALRAKIPGRKDAVNNSRMCLVYICIKVLPSIEVVRINAKRMARELDMPLRTCTGALQRLVDAGLIALDRFQYGDDRRYILRIDPGSQNQTR